jgi:protein gp37
MNNSTETSPLDYQWSPWKRPKGQFPEPVDRLLHARHKCVYVPEDWLDPDVPVDWLVNFLALIRATPQITWLLSTWRPGDWLRRVDAQALLKLEMEEDRETIDLQEWLRDWIEGTPPSNVWVGSPISSQEQADSLIPKLLAIPSVGRFILCDPLLGPVDLTSVSDDEEGVQFNCLTGAWGLDFAEPKGDEDTTLDWVSIGGETGPDARPCNIDWIRSLVRQCKDAAVPVRVERLGSKPEGPDNGTYAGEPPETEIVSWSKWITHPDGEDPSEWPHDLRVREIPEGLR